MSNGGAGSRASRRIGFALTVGLVVSMTGPVLAARAASAGPSSSTTSAPARAALTSRRLDPPRVDSPPSRWIVQQVRIRTGVDTDGDGLRDRVAAVFVRPPASDVHRRKLATVIWASPYFNCCGNFANHDVDVPLHVPGPVGNQVAKSFAGYWVRHGYAVLLMDSLGSGGSTGCPTIGDAREAAGPVAAIDWLNGRTTATTPAGRPIAAGWANGRAAMTGTSYDGTLPNMAAATGVEGLLAIAPTSAISRWYDYYRVGGHVVAPGGYQGEDADVLADFVYTRRDQRICQPVIRQLAQQEDRVTGDDGPFWAARDLLPHAGDVHAAVLIEHGLGDDNVRPVHAAQWYAALHAAGAPVALYWTQGLHGAGAPRSLERRWFDHYVYGVDNGIDRTLPVWVEDRAATRRYAAWPSPAAVPTTYALRPRGSALTGGLEAGGAPGAGTESFTDRPDRTFEQLAATPQPARGLVFRGPRLSGPAVLSGTPVAQVGLAFSQPAGNVSVALVVYGPNGRVRWVSRGWADPQNRTSLSLTEPVTPGTTYDLTVPLQPVDLALGAGDRIGLVVMSTEHDHTLRPPAGNRLTLDLSRSDVVVPLAPG